MRPLTIAYANAGFTLEDFMPQALAERKPMLADFEMVCRLYRTLAIGSLLMAGHPRGFFENLFRSSRAFVFFAEASDPAERLTGRAQAFFDAIVCHDSEGARRMAAALPSTPDPAREYEEDFYHVRCCMDLSSGASATALRPMLERWAEVVSEGMPDLRLPVWQALANRDQAAFDEALPEAIREEKARLAKLQEEGALAPDLAPMLTKLSIEVLAYVDLAVQCGLKVHKDYPMAPSLARAFHLIPKIPPDAWRMPEQFGGFAED